MNHNDKYTGCLIGGAVGDALGYPVEFMSDLSIVSSFGKYGITEYSLNNGIAVFSDDTQMTLFTAVALLSADAQNGGSFDSDKYLKIMADSYSDYTAAVTRERPALMQYSISVQVFTAQLKNPSITVRAVAV